MKHSKRACLICEGTFPTLEMFINFLALLRLTVSRPIPKPSTNLSRANVMNSAQMFSFPERGDGGALALLSLQKRLFAFAKRTMTLLIPMI